MSDYTKAKDRNNSAVEEPRFPRYYEEFDYVLGTRDGFVLPEVKERGFCPALDTSPPASSTSEIGSGIPCEDDKVSEEYLAAIDIKCKNRPDQKDTPVAKKKSKYDEMVALQYAQIDAFEKSDLRHNDFMKAMFEKQGKDDEKESDREKEGDKKTDIFLELGKLFSK